MKDRRQLLAKVVRVRKKLRDVEAARHATANQASHEARVICQDAEGTLGALMDQAPRTFCHAHSANALLLFDWERRDRIARIDDAQQTIIETDKKTSTQRRALETQERKLRISEKLLEKARRTAAARRERKEQEMNDDITATRARRVS